MNGEVQQAWQRQRMGLLSNSSMISSLSSCKLCGVLQDCACSHACGSDVAAAAACLLSQVSSLRLSLHFHLLVAVLPAAQLDCRWHRHWTVQPSNHTPLARWRPRANKLWCTSPSSIWITRSRRVAAGSLGWPPPPPPHRRRCQKLRPTGTPCGAFLAASYRALLLSVTACACPWHSNPSSAGGDGCAAAHPRARPGRGAGAHEAAPRQPGRQGLKQPELRMCCPLLYGGLTHTGWTACAPSAPSNSTAVPSLPPACPAQTCSACRESTQVRRAA